MELLEQGYVPIDPQRIKMLFNMSRDPIPNACIEFIKQSLFQNGVQFQVNGQSAILSDYLVQIINRYWIPEAKKILEHIMTIGFFVKAEMCLPDGNIAFRVLHPSTYIVYVKYDVEQECNVYQVIRQIPASSLTPQAIKENLVRKSIRLDVATAIDWTQFFIDPGAMVVDGFGYDPSPFGEINSVMSTMYLDILRINVERHLYKQQQLKVSYAVPYLQMEAVSDQFLKEIINQRLPPDTQKNEISSVIQNMSEANRKAYLGCKLDHIIYCREYGLEYTPDPETEYLAGYLERSGRMKTQQDQAIKQAEQNQFHEMPAGGSVASYTPPVDSKHLPVHEDLFRKTVLNAFQLPQGLYDATGNKTQSSDNLQQRRIETTVDFWGLNLSLCLTDIYRSIYGKSDDSWFMEQFVVKWLTDDAIKETERLLRLRKRKHKAPEQAPSKDPNVRKPINIATSLNDKEKGGHKSDTSTDDETSDSDSSSGSDSDRDNKPKTKKKKTKKPSNKRKRNDSDSDFDDDRGEESIEEIIESTNYLATIDDIIKALRAARDEDKDPLFKQFESQDGKLSKTIKSAKEMYQVMGKSEVTIVFAKKTALTTAQLILYNTLGAMNSFECKNALRAQAGLGAIQTEEVDGILNNNPEIQRVMGAYATEDALKDTNIAPILSLTQQLIQQDTEEKVNAAVEEVKREYELKLLKEQMKASFAQKQQQMENKLQQKTMMAGGGAAGASGGGGGASKPKKAKTKEQ
jgi:hypothetical protein